MNNGWFLPLGILLVLLTSLSTAVGCQAYDTLTLEEDEIRFSFEYPATFRVEVSGMVGSSDGLFHAGDVHLEARGTAGIRKVIVFWIFHAGENNPSAAALLERRLSSESEQEGFKLLERDTITVAGVEGEIIVFTTPDPKDPVLALPEEASVWREAFFDYDSQTWAIIMGSEKATVKADDAIFEHILKTLQILN
jgi:hypothetical protein